MRKRYLLPTLGIVVGLFLVSIPTFALGTSAMNWFNHRSMTTGNFEPINEELNIAVNSLTIKGANIKNIDISFHDKETTLISGMGDLTQFNVTVLGTELMIKTQEKAWNNSLFFVGTLNTQFEFDTLKVVLPVSFSKGKIAIETLVSDIRITGNDQLALNKIDIESLSSMIVLDGVQSNVEIEGFNFDLQTVNSGGHWEVNAVNVTMHSELLEKALELDYDVAHFNGMIVGAPDAGHSVVLSGLSLAFNFNNDTQHAVGGLSHGTSGATDIPLILVEGSGVSQSLKIR